MPTLVLSVFCPLCRLFTSLCTLFMLVSILITLVLRVFCLPYRLFTDLSMSSNLLFRSSTLSMTPPNLLDAAQPALAWEAWFCMLYLTISLSSFESFAASRDFSPSMQFLVIFMKPFVTDSSCSPVHSAWLSMRQSAAAHSVWVNTMSSIWSIPWLSGSCWGNSWWGGLTFSWVLWGCAGVGSPFFWVGVSLVVAEIGVEGVAMVGLVTPPLVSCCIIFSMPLSVAL